MSAVYDRSHWQCIDYVAVKQVAVYQHWPVSELNYCLPEVASLSLPQKLGLTKR
jgi:hypothetical protein